MRNVQETLRCVSRPIVHTTAIVVIRQDTAPPSVNTRMISAEERLHFCSRLCSSEQDGGGGCPRTLASAWRLRSVSARETGSGKPGFADFLTRLKTLNPAVDLSSFPADRWPGLVTSAKAQTTTVRQGIRGALFPSAILILLIWLAVETFR